ncbi:ATP-binding protein [Streptomyces sp. NPDC006551]|uniref:ATP-binding protein n=1 Tax=Streptomyces sp. NPDC006551 TaxID=3157178 RepID=UPI0033AADB1A
MTTSQQHGTARARRFPLTGGPGVVAECRDLARQALREWFGQAGAPGQTAAEDVLLLVSEVVTNAYTHGGTPYELCLHRTDGRLWVQVSDTSPVHPRPRGPHRPTRSSGHGLYLLERLSVAWGSLPRSKGKAVWFEVEVLGRAAEPGADGGDRADGAERADTADRPDRSERADRTGRAERAADGAHGNRAATRADGGDRSRQATGADGALLSRTARTAPPHDAGPARPA